MFYNLVYRSPLWKSLDHNSRNLRVVIAGTVFYIGMHYYIYSNYVDSYQLILDYRKYIYYLFFIDLIVLLLFMFLIDDNKKVVKKKKKQQLRLPIMIPPHIPQIVTPSSMPSMHSMHSIPQMPPVSEKSKKNNTNKETENDSQPIPIYKTFPNKSSPQVDTEMSPAIPLYK